MAFDLKNLRPVFQDGTDGPDIWIYNSTDALTVIRVVDYFLGAIDRLEVNDLIQVVSDTGGTPVHSWNIVNENDGTTIDVTDGDVIDATDGD